MFYSNKFIYIWCSLVTIIVGGLYVPDMISFYGGAVVAALLIGAVYFMAFKKPEVETDEVEDHTTARASDPHFLRKAAAMMDNNYGTHIEGVTFSRGYMERLKEQESVNGKRK